MRLRVLVTAYACEAGVGSESGIGWNWVREIARRHNVTLITRRNNVGHVTRSAREDGSMNLHVLGYDLPRGIVACKRGSRGAVPYFALWQRGVAGLAARLHREEPFDLTHHLTFASSWIGSGLARVEAPFVWGPVGHHDPIPPRFLSPLNLLGHGSERAKAMLRRCVPTLDPLARATRERADVILSLGGSIPGPLSSAAARRVVPMLACGVARPDEADLVLDRGTAPLDVVFAGRLVDLKGPQLAVAAFAELLHTEPKASLTLIGDGPRRRRLEQQVRRLGIEPQVQFLGRLSHEATLERLGRAHVFLFPSFEGAGMVVVEALAHGCPVVCLDTGGPGQMVASDRGRKATLFARPEQAITGLAEGLRSLALDEGLRAHLARGARDWALKHATWEAKGRRLEGIYSRALDNYHGVAPRRAA